MKRVSGVTLLEERDGEGASAQKGDRVVYNMKLFLNKGDEVPLNARQAEHLPKDMLRVEEGGTFIDHKIVLGKRQAIAGVAPSPGAGAREPSSDPGPLRVTVVALR